MSMTINDAIKKLNEIQEFINVVNTEFESKGGIWNRLEENRGDAHVRIAFNDMANGVAEALLHAKVIKWWTLK